MTTPIISLENVTKNYALGSTVVTAVSGVSFVIREGEFTAIAGPSGSGKTTLLNLIGCIDTASEGVVSVRGHNTAALSDRRLTRLRLDTIGFIFQNFNLINVLTVVQNVEFPLLLAGGLSSSERQERVNTLLAKVGLAQFAKHRPNELSGGQRQRVAIARALVTRPKLVLADEPTANLDSATGTQIIDLMHELNRNEKTTFLFSTHDHRIMDRAERLIQVADGRIASDEQVQR